MFESICVFNSEDMYIEIETPNTRSQSVAVHFIIASFRYSAALLFGGHNCSKVHIPLTPALLPCASSAAKRGKNSRDLRFTDLEAT